MTQEAFIEKLRNEGYSYEIVGDRIIVTGGTDFGDVWLDALTSLPPGVEFRNKGDVYLNSLPNSLPPGVEFRNGGNVNLGRLKSLPPGVEFRNNRGVSLRSLTSLPPGVKFRNKGEVYLDSFFKVFGISDWKGNIKGIDPKRLLNVMIKQGVFI